MPSAMPTAVAVAKPTDNDAILELSQTITTLSRDFEDGKIPDKQTQNALVNAAEQLAIATRDSDENMYYFASQVKHTQLMIRIDI